jgi:hypothetical protein
MTVYLSNNEINVLSCACFVSAGQTSGFFIRVRVLYPPKKLFVSVFFVLFSQVVEGTVCQFSLGSNKYF